MPEIFAEGMVDLARLKANRPGATVQCPLAMRRKAGLGGATRIQAT
jgi:hypothetical protein